MTEASIDTRWRLRSLQAVILENSFLRAVVLPEYGGRIYSIRYKPLDRELLWQSPRIPLHKPPFGAVYGDVWCGGWDEVFPNDAPAVIEGERYPDHGELWANEWNWRAEEEGEGVSVELWCRTAISAVEVRKKAVLGPGAARLSVTYQIFNDSRKRMPFLFKAHPAFAVAAGWRLDFPAMDVRLDPCSAGSLSGAELEARWPVVSRAGQKIDLSEIPDPSSGAAYFFYGTGYEQGWCALTDPHARVSAGLVFPAQAFPACWLFSSYGGWRNNELALLEPSTGWPLDLNQAMEQGTIAVLEPGAVWEATVTLQVQQGLEKVSELTPEGGFAG